MKKIIEIFNELQSHTGNKDKENIIKQNLHNRLFVDVMKFLLNDFVLTGISKKKIDKKVDVDCYCDIKITDFYSLRDYLKENNSGRDLDIQYINLFLNTLNEELVELYKGLITKSIKLGVSAKTWNKVCSSAEQIPLFEVMLAKKFEDHSHKIKGDFTITKKLDGTRCVIIKDEFSTKAYSRTGKEIEGLNEILDGIDFMSDINMVYDGELLAEVDESMSTQEQFAETLKRSRTKDKNKTGLCFHVFDMIPLDEFQQGYSKLNHIDRRDILENVVLSYAPNHIEYVEALYQGNDFQMISNWAKKAEEMEWEGVMISLDKPYVCKRTDSLLKVKKMLSCDLRVVGFEEGDGRNKGKLGAIICEYKDSTVKVGSGWSDDMRDSVWNNKEDWLNTIVEVQYFEESMDSKTDEVSLRFPVFKCRRFDKTEPSYN